MTVSFTVKNVGDRCGAEAAQVYVSAPGGSVSRPVKELAGFQKVLLKSGENIKIHIELGRDAFSFWDPVTKKWRMELGDYKILVGRSSQDILLSQTIKME